MGKRPRDKVIRIESTLKREVVAAAQARGLTLKEFVARALRTTIRSSRQRQRNADPWTQIHRLIDSIEHQGGPRQEGRRGYWLVGLKVASLLRIPSAIS